MAVIYSKPDGDQIVIGGTINTGPFPKYSVNRETILSGDQTPLGNKYSISVSGKILTDSDQDISITGAMQSNLHGKIIAKLQTDIVTAHNVGKLEIVPYGGQPNTIEFLDARLISIDIPEQDDDSSGILYSDYTFNFEAYIDVSNLDDTSSFALNSVEESWEVSIDEDAAYTGSNLENPKRTFTITHSISATGRKSFSSGPIFSASAWKEAAEWVKTRVVSSPASTIITDAIGNDEVTPFNPNTFDSAASINSTDITSLSYYNHTRTPNCDIASGTYSVTETWKASASPALLDMEINIEQDESQTISIVLSGTITGLDTTSLNNIAITKLANAETVLSAVDSSAFAICDAYYTDSLTLQNVIRAKSIGRNKATGVITFSYTFNDTLIYLDGALSTTITVTDDNEYRLNKVIAVIPIIGKEDGPVIQDMGTTPERKRSVQIQSVMDKDHRTAKPAEGVTLALSYAPNDAYLQSLIEEWDKTTGSYSINAEWVY